MAQQFEGVTATAAAAGLARVREKMIDAAERSGRTVDAVTVVAATKYVDAEGSAALIDGGILELGENRLDSLESKQDAGIGADASGVRWHFIGRLQSRQAPSIATRVSMIHSLCTESAAARLAGLEHRPELLVQVNVAGDPAKDGLATDAVEAFLLALPPELEVRGFMAMPAFADDPEASRPAFSALRELRDRLAPRLVGRHRLEYLSIGTSQDWAVAVEEGATHVRLGRILYASGE